MRTPTFIVCGLLASAICPVFAADPPELNALRARHVAALWEVDAPVVSDYVKSLALLQDRFTKEGKPQAAVAVDNELNKVLADLHGASHPHHVPVVNILSATYREVADHSHSVDTTAVVKKAFESGAPHLRLTTKEGAEGKDPAYNQKKETLITYTSDGEKKDAVFPESATLNFRRDLK
jgi:hypothetical protein